MFLPKFNYWRSRRYLDWVKTLPCACGCGRSPCDPHHPKRSVMGFGRGIKSSDEFAYPLWRECHDRVEANPKDHEDIEWRWSLLTLAKAVREGIFRLQ